MHLPMGFSHQYDSMDGIMEQDVGFSHQYDSMDGIMGQDVTSIKETRDISFPEVQRFVHSYVH